jgi:hypothetical protein
VAPNPHWDQLENLLTGLSQNIVFNLCGEGLPQAYDNSEAVASFILNGGVWVDYCGEPFYYQYQPASGSIAGGWTTFAEQSTQLLQSILSGIGDAIPISGMFESDSGIFDCTPGYQFPRGIMTRENFLAAQNVTAIAKYQSSCYRLVEQLYVYGACGIKSALSGGWYFYAYDNQAGAGVSPSDFATMMISALNGHASTGTGGSTVGSTGGSPGSTGTGTGSSTSNTGSGGSPGAGGEPGSTTSSASGFLASLTTTDKIIGGAAVAAVLLGGILLFS